MKKTNVMASAMLGAVLSLDLNAATVSSSDGVVTVTWDDTISGLLYGISAVNGTTASGYIVDLDIIAPFEAVSENGAGFIQTDGAITFTIEIDNSAGFGIDQLFVRESGEYEIAGNGEVGQSGTLTVDDNDTFNLGATNTVNYAAGNTASGDLTATGSLTPWMSSVGFYDIVNFFGTDVTSRLVDVTINNSLVAESFASGDFARITKNGSDSVIRLGINTNPPIPTPSEVPVPAAFWLFGAALLSLKLVRR